MLLTRYYSRKYIRSFFDVAAIAIILLSMSSLITELRYLSPTYTSADAITYALYSIPGAVIKADSVILCVATVVFFLRLRKSKELLVGHIFGLSMIQVLRGIIPLVIALITMLTVNREWLAPQVSMHAKQWRIQKTLSGAVYAHPTNKVWLYTQSGFLSAQMVSNFKELRDVNYYQFKNDQLVSWYYSRSANYIHGEWVAASARKAALKNGHVVKYSVEKYRLPIRIKPHVLEGASLIPEFATLRQILDSMYRGRDYGISNQTTWMMLTARITRPINLFLIFVWVFVVLEHATLPRLKGLVARIFLTIFLVISERIAYEFITTAQTTATVSTQVGYALCLPLAMLVAIFYARYYFSQSRTD